MSLSADSVSVHARLVKLARTTGRPFQEILQHFAIERFLHRLSVSKYRDRFVLKGALTMRIWDPQTVRPTRDIDLLGHLDNAVDAVESAVRDICGTAVSADGVAFDPKSVWGTEIQADAQYPGVGVRFQGTLAKARLGMHVDVGFGDRVVLPDQLDDYPTLLDMPAPRVRCYTREALIAEKFQAMVYLGTINSRLKDFHDIWWLAQRFDFDGTTLLAAIRATFSARETSFEPVPVALTERFGRAAEPQSRWVAFVRKATLQDPPMEFHRIVAALRGFLLPLVEAGAREREFASHWKAPGPWIPMALS